MEAYDRQLSANGYLVREIIDSVSEREVESILLPLTNTDVLNTGNVDNGIKTG